MIQVTAPLGGGGSSPSDRCYHKLPEVQPPGSVVGGVTCAAEPYTVPGGTCLLNEHAAVGKPTKDSPALSCAEGSSQRAFARNSAAAQKQVQVGSNHNEFSPGAVNVPKAEDKLDSVSF